jgi:hypothetical protein
LGLVTVGDIGVETGACNLQAEDADSKADEWDILVCFPDCGAEDDEAEGHEYCGEDGEVETCLWLADVVVSASHVEHNVIGCSPCEEFTNDGPDDEGNSQHRADGTGLELVELGVDCCDADSGHDVDESPSPEVVEEREDDGGIFEHIEGCEEVREAERSSRDHVASERPEHVHVGTLCGALGKKCWITGEEGFGEEKQCNDEGDRRGDGANVVVPLPAFGLTEEATNCMMLMMFEHCVWLFCTYGLQQCGLHW